MSISVYSYCTNAIKDEFFLIEGIKSALLFADEVVVMDGGSTDETISKIEEIKDNRIKVYRNDWLDSLGKSMGAINRSLAIGRCTSDWCILMDADEVFHEEDAEEIKDAAKHIDSDIIAAEFNTIHFYKDYGHTINNVPDWKDLYNKKVYMVRNGLGIHHGAIGMEPDGHVDINGQPIPHDKRMHIPCVNMYHYGHTRTKESYVKKYNKIHSRHKGWWNYTPLTMDEFEWKSEWKLNKFEGTHPAVMNDRMAVGLDSYDKIMELYK